MSCKKKFNINTIKGRTLHHDVKGKMDQVNFSTRSPAGTGILAGGAIRSVWKF